jgi:hypothetical protein
MPRSVKVSLSRTSRRAVLLNRYPVCRMASLHGFIASWTCHDMQQTSEFVLLLHKQSWVCLQLSREWRSTQVQFCTPHWALLLLELTSSTDTALHAGIHCFFLKYALQWSRAIAETVRCGLVTVEPLVHSQVTSCESHDVQSVAGVGVNPSSFGFPLLSTSPRCVIALSRQRIITSSYLCHFLGYTVRKLHLCIYQYIHSIKKKLGKENCINGGLYFLLRTVSMWKNKWLVESKNEMWPVIF